jgi:tetratricopeptide (TPR) repeat protein
VRIFILVWLAHAGWHSAHAQSPAYEALQSIYAFQFDEYETRLAQLPERNSPTTTLLQLFYWRWKGVPVAYSTYRKSYVDRLNSFLNALEKEPDNSSTIVYHRICTLLFLAEYHASIGQTWQAVKFSQRAYPLISRVFEERYIEPEFDFVRGLYLYYIDHYREKSFFFRAAFLPFRDGDKASGLRLLQQCAARPSMAQVEARIFLAHIYLHLENKPVEALHYSTLLSEAFPANLKLQELHVETLLENGLHEKAAPLAMALAAQPNFYFACPGYFFQGNLAEQLGQRELAQSYYQKCLSQQFKPIESYQKRAQQRLRQLK